MKLEQQVCSLELAKRLRELEVKQESLFWWHDGCSALVKPHVKRQNDYCVGTQNGSVSAFTVAELGEMLPIEYISQRRPYGSIGANEYRWLTGKYDDDYVISASTEADARAKMLIYLLEKKLITV